MQAGSGQAALWFSATKNSLSSSLAIRAGAAAARRYAGMPGRTPWPWCRTRRGRRAARRVIHHDRGADAGIGPAGQRRHAMRPPDIIPIGRTDPKFNRIWPAPPGANSKRARPTRPRNQLIPTRLNLDLFQVGVAGEAAQAFWGECIPGSAERIDDGVTGIEQAVAPMLLAQVQPDPLHRVDLG